MNHGYVWQIATHTAPLECLATSESRCGSVIGRLKIAGSRSMNNGVMRV